MHVRKAAKAKLKRTDPKATNFDWADRLVEAWQSINAAKRHPDNRMHWWVKTTPTSEPVFAVREHEFDRSKRRFDLALPILQIAIECQGGENVHFMGHRSKEGVMKDVRKANDAGLLGWRVIYFTGQDVLLRPLSCLATLDDAIREKLG